MRSGTGLKSTPNAVPFAAGVNAAVPTAVAAELAEGRQRGVDVPDLGAFPWIMLREPRSQIVLPMMVDLGPGETAVLALALESQDAVVILDDGLARRHAERLGLGLTGTLGILIDAKHAGHVDAVAPLLDALQSLYRFSIGFMQRRRVG